ncbi:GH116 family glycosyl-hydrolase [Rhodopirellula sallentina]|uniref:Glucosylceramidase domain protein n=1 Tax=Rhodopirellula sallentina SM41 TaxID=1263870 RepID=M5TW08_9BACT|nr:GH116 family glycosyl-hydrolase [Rhodopirellula sallentina]EMI53397.1 Glucosylceramidase domain protein [Rhodopirellula sallentina SM41]
MCKCDSGETDCTRREVITLGAIGATQLAMTGSAAMAGPFTQEDVAEHLVPADKKLSSDWIASLTKRGTPEVFRDAQLKYVGMPIGGIGCGQLYLGGDGKLWLWDIFKSNYRREPDHGQRIAAFTLGGHYAHPVSQGNQYTKWNGADVAQGFLVRTDAGTKTLDREGFPGVTFRGEYPIGKVTYAEDGYPITVQLEAFSPFIPLSAKDSAIPATVMRYTVVNESDAALDVELGGWMQNATCPYIDNANLGERHNSVIDADGHVSLVGTVTGSRVAGKHGDGSMTLSLLHSSKEPGLTISAASSLYDPDTPSGLFDQALPLEQKNQATKPLDDLLVGGLFVQVYLEPGESKTLDFVITWYFPEYTEIESLPIVKRTQDSRHLFRGKKRFYATRFESAEDVATYLANDNKSVIARTRQWNQTWYDSTLPYWLLDRSFIPLDCIATQTFHYFDDGRPYAWEGVDCCPGTCTHVWHYAQALSRIFPELERAFREKVDFQPGVGLELDTGLIKDRADFHANGKEAVDGQAGTIIRVYREHQMSADDTFLKRLWPSVKLATEFLIRKDADGSGMLEGKQPHTLDAAWFGPMGWLSSVYLGALAAAEAMAIEVGDSDFAHECRGILDRGYENIVAEVFDGEYFIHKPTAARALNTNRGCHIDQVLGQAWMHQVGLGRVIPKTETVSALNSLWKYNFAPDAGQYALDHVEIEQAFRWYAMPGEAGLLMTTWPKGGAVDAIPGVKLRTKGKNPDRFTGAGGYFNECMNGFEYQVAAHMVYEGGPDSELVQKGLAIAKAVHERYGAAKRNPYNEIECSDHYARSMASYGVFLAACGFEYHGPKGRLAFAPRVNPDDFKAAFTTAEGWGSFSQSVNAERQIASIELRYGQLSLREFGLAQVTNVTADRVNVEVDGAAIEAELTTEAGRYLVKFGRRVVLHEDQTMKLEFV